MKNASKLGLPVLVLLIIQLLSSCNSQKVLHADFEDDVINTFPRLDLPGDPTGDLIQWYGAPGEHLKVVSRADDNDQTANWLLLDQSTLDPSFYPGLLSFVPTATSIENSLFTFTWVGKIGGPPNSSLLDVSISISENSNHQSDSVISLLMKPQPYVSGEGYRRFGVYLYENGMLSNEPIGILRSGITHSVIITISEENNEYTIAGIGHTITRAFSQDLTLNQPTLSFIFNGFPGIGNYEINYVGIHEDAR